MERSSRRHWSSVAILLVTCTVLAAGNGASGSDGRDERGQHAIERVLLISVDGLHQTDLARFIALNPASTLARLAERGVQYPNAHATTPSDSFPGLLALVTGGTPRSTGVYYDDSYDRTLYPPGSNCQGKQGTECTYFEIAEVDFTKLFSPLDPDNLPHAKDAQGRCIPVFPHDFIKVNTVFEVIRAAGGHTAWSDKHPAYDLVNGPSGKGVEDLYTPEINSPIANGGTVNGVDLSATLAQCDGTTNSLPLSQVGDYTTCGPAVMAYDDVKVQAVINQIRGTPGTIFSTNIVHGEELAAIYGDPTSGDPIAAARAPNVVIQPDWGVIYSGSSKKIAEHGGGTLDDTNVALLVSNPRLRRRTVEAHVTTTQVAPTILEALDLDPRALDAVRKEGTKSLPGLGL